MIMATSTFGKQFTVKPKKADAFVKEMTKTATPTLKKDFTPHLVHECDLKDSLKKALTK